MQPQCFEILILVLTHNKNSKLRKINLIQAVMKYENSFYNRKYLYLDER